MKKSDWTLVKEAEKDGRVVAMSSIVEHNRTELNERLSEYFRKEYPDYIGVFSDDEAEEVLDRISDFMNYDINFPIDNSDILLIPITNNLSAKLLVVDEYYGSGDYEKYIDISYFVISEKATESDVDSLMKFVENVL